MSKRQKYTFQQKVKACEDYKSGKYSMAQMPNEKWATNVSEHKIPHDTRRIEIKYKETNQPWNTEKKPILSLQNLLKLFMQLFLTICEKACEAIKPHKLLILISYATVGLVLANFHECLIQSLSTFLSGLLARGYCIKDGGIRSRCSLQLSIIE